MNLTPLHRSSESEPAASGMTPVHRDIDGVLGQRTLPAKSCGEKRKMKFMSVQQS
jgi:hypothetical protein